MYVCMYDFVLYPGRLSLIDPSYKWIQNHAVYISVYLFLFCKLSVCVCFVQWLRRRITDEDPAFCCVWCLGSKRFFFSHLFEVSYFSYYMSIRCGVVCVTLCVREAILPLRPSLMWHLRCLSTFLST